MSGKRGLEAAFERVLFAMRWIMAPVYLGLALSLALLMVVFLREFLQAIPDVLALSPEKLILTILTLIDLTLAGNLVVIVLFSGYENFVSKFDLDARDDRPTWMGRIDFSGLKIKLIGSIVAISGIHLLKRFMEIGREDGPLAVDELRWLVIIHMAFVVSGLLLAAMDWLKERGAGHD